MCLRLIAVIAFLCAGVLLSRGILTQARELHQSGRPTPLGARYVRLLDQIPPDARLGYVSDHDQWDKLGQNMFYETAYALPPRIVHWGVDDKEILANFVDAKQIDEICAR